VSQNLDVAQLLKHYFALRKFQEVQIMTPTHGKSKIVTLLYLFWEPVNWQELSVCQVHRQQAQSIEATVSSSAIRMRWMTYDQLWEEWGREATLVEHVRNLKARYSVAI
jgi:hypothetical protein